ncbi:MAG: hypothetical protein UT17_C0003G0252 [Candidatus Woesebacteria bacterium GW2011_GWB1_39_10]|uniref:Uncharacterized protein n=2 Tax=Candidatus Woeseibacteriota TaxID=1752722 RepID=A0A0G0P2A5_9BACT|nr:MAG: hypothetical protein UT17_C0003G0252 [Candidatus Woesebacteria bacterium GW2011_GWB1_39_10]KKS91189.1 MAG: hypothetical protein UV66_C0001G0546 [Candidatus Woesebacteria bacterium GW2011_GWA1_43_12]
MDAKSTLRINEEPNEFDDHILDLMGNSFNFSHEKGMAEWLKNSVDAYLREQTPDSKQLIIFRFFDGVTEPLRIECLDFVGMSALDINKALKRWGDPKAAKRGMDIKVFGGHGNGGKFYMRQMFKESFFITYRDGNLNIFGFNERKKYGFASGYKDKKCTWKEALKVAGVDISEIPEDKLKLLSAGETGFTLIRGTSPKKIVGKRISVGRIMERFKYHPQARRPLKFCRVQVAYNGKVVINQVKMDEIESLPDFVGPFVYEMPETLTFEEGGKTKTVKISDSKYPGKLELKTSAIPFGHSSNSRIELNCVDITGEVGVIASYRMHELGFLKHYPQAQFIYGECECPILEREDGNSIQNDREKLVSDSDETKALLGWIAEKVDGLASEISAVEEKQKERSDYKATQEFNDILNKWKDQFMSKIFAEVFGGINKGNSTGGLGDDGFGGGNRDKSKEKGGLGSGAGNGGGEGDEKKKSPRFPRVLLSGQDDPLSPGSPVTFSDRHYPVEQRQQDVNEGVYWINLEKPLAKKIIEKYTVDSPRWRSYLFERYVDIFMKEAIWRLAKHEGGTIRPEIADSEIMKIISIVYDKASVDLENFLLDDKYRKEEN